MNRVKVNFSGTHPVEQWGDLRAAIEDRMPLRTLHWKSPARTSIRTIQELHVSLVADSSNKSDTMTLLERPLLNLYAVSCDDNETYKTTVKRQIQEWIAQIKGQEWMILYVVRPDALAQGKRLFAIKVSVLDKLKADFNVDKRDRCAQLSWAKGADDPAAWADFITKMKEGIMSSFDTAVISREEQVRRSESQRMGPGWNFCSFCSLKETLASSFEAMSLLEDAQIQFDELEASYFQVSKERYGSPLSEFGGQGPKDDSLPLLSVSKKPYREMIIAGTISVFDFRSYLLARQCTLLARRGDVLSTVKKANWFVNAFGRSMREHESYFGRFFIESWMYSAALNIVDQCAEWFSTTSMDPAILSAYYGIKGELLELARNQLERIGIAVGYLPASPPFSMALMPSPSPTPAANTSSAVTQKDLLASISDRETFDKLYIITTNRCIEYYTTSNRKRSALKMHGSLAALDHLRTRLNPALSTFSSLPAHYIGTQWVGLEGIMLARSLRIHNSMGKPRDQEWLTLALAFLKAFVALDRDTDAARIFWNGVENDDNSVKEDVQHVEQGINGFIETIVKDISVCATDLGKEFVFAEHPVFQYETKAHYRAVIDEEKDGSTLQLAITSQLSCPIEVDKITLELSGAKGLGRIQFSHSEQLELGPGSNNIRLFCPTSTAGIYTAEMLIIQSSKLHFHYPHRQKPNPNHSKAIANMMTVRIPYDAGTLDADIEFPNSIEFGLSPRLVFVINTGRNDIANLTLNVGSISQQISFKCEGAEIQGEAGSISSAESSLTLETLQARTRIAVSIPFEGSLQGSPVPIFSRIMYRTQKNSDVVRTIQREKKLSGALPVVVNVQDFFRGPTLLSRFTVSSDGRQYVRIHDARLIGSTDSLLIKNARSQTKDRRHQYVTPQRPLHLLFQMIPADGRKFENAGGLRFILSYRTLDEELDLRLHSILDRLYPLESSSSSQSITESVTYSTLIGSQIRRAWLVDTFLRVIRLDRDWVETYATTGRLVPPSLPPQSKGKSNKSNEEQDLWQWSKKLREAIALPRLGNDDDTVTLSDLEIDAVAELLKELAKNLGVAPEVTGDETEIRPPRELILPLELPTINILNAVNISLPSKPTYAGHPIDCTLTIASIFRFRSSLEENEESVQHSPTKYRMRYEVLGSELNSWLISGRNRDEFEAKNGQTHTIHLTLIPLRHGALPLPTVSVIPVQADGVPPSCETHQEHAAVRATILPRSAQTTYTLSLPSPRSYAESEVDA